MDNQMQIEPPRRLTRYTPLRYPGGKGKLSTFVKNIMEANSLVDGHYVEPYAGGAGVALELLFHEYASHIHINDISRPIYSFWKSVVDNTEDLLKLIHDTKPTVSAWDKQKKIVKNSEDYDDTQLGFATFFLNRTNRSGILNGGIIGGRDQSGPWKMDARYNIPELMFRVESIANMKRRITVTCLDAVDFIKRCSKDLPSKSLIYLDPPYYVKGKDLYLSFYSHDDHQIISDIVKKKLGKISWIISYDNAPEIRSLYKEYSRITYDLGYSAREARTGSEVMFFSHDLDIPETIKAMQRVRRYVK